MKKLIALALSAVMTASSFVGVMAANDAVEISFKVGESTLLINGSAVEVETPYVVGEGTTLVPLRVISEAFGAEVEWYGDTKSIILTYGTDVIVLQIDNNIAVVNGVDTTIAEAPRLTQNGYTMVPLRFISESFGAEVGYDEPTRAVTVTKTASEKTAQFDEEIVNAAAALNLSDSDLKMIIDGYTDIRYSFEQSVLPSEVLYGELPSVENQEEFTEALNGSWGFLTSYVLLSVLTESDTTYTIESEEDAKALQTFLESANLTSEKNIENIDYTVNDGTTIVVLTMQDSNEILISKYIGITCDKDGKWRYFTLEKSFGEMYMFCETTLEGRINYGIVECSPDAFTEAIKSV